MSMAAALPSPSPGGLLSIPLPQPGLAVFRRPAGRWLHLFLPNAAELLGASLTLCTLCPPLPEEDATGAATGRSVQGPWCVIATATVPAVAAGEGYVWALDGHGAGAGELLRLAVVRASGSTATVALAHARGAGRA